MGLHTRPAQKERFALIVIQVCLPHLHIVENAGLLSSMVNMKVATSWSGGKESCFACYKAMQKGFEVFHLLNFISLDTGRCMGHGLDSKLIHAQSQATEIPIIQKMVTWDTYEEGFKDATRELKKEGLEGVVFGDVDIQEHKDWVNRVCKELNIEPIEPLWGADPEKILKEFINEGFEAIVVGAKADLFGKEWLGRTIDENFMVELKRLKEKSEFHILGEAGEYHTFVTNGPIFRRKIIVSKTTRLLTNGRWSLKILGWEII